jgi:hypothetical protein
MSVLEDTVVLDRKTFEELWHLIGNCIEAITELQHTSVFIASARRCLLDTPNFQVVSSVEVGEAVLLMDTWFKTVPQSHKEIDGWLQQANATACLVLFLMKSGKSHG